MCWVRKFISLSLFVLLSPCIISQNVHQEKTVQKKIEEGFRYLYDFQFHKADSISSKILASYPNEALAHLLRAHYYWYLIISGLNNQINQGNCKTALINAEKLQHNKKNSTLSNDELFTKITIQVLFARLESLNGNEWSSFTHLNKGTNSIKHSLNKEKYYPYFLLVNGLYLYYRSYAMSAYPYLAPYLVLMPSGNEASGLKMLRTATGVQDAFLSCESKYFLMKLCMARGWNQEAIDLSRSLHQTYPKNLLFAYYHAVMCKNMNQMKELDGIYKKILMIDQLKAGYLPGQKEYFIVKVRELMDVRR